MSRQSRVTADVTLEAHNMLRDYCKKHERSKGFLIEKMIRKFCVEPPEGGVAVVATSTEEKPLGFDLVKTNIKKQSSRFVPPKFFDVDEYMRSRMCPDPITQAEKFCDFYESNGWKVGKNKMKCWKAAARNWLKSSGAKHQQRVAGKTSGNLSACEDFINE